MKVTNAHDRPLTIAATGQTVEPGDSAEVDAELGESLLEQTDRWSAPKPAKKATKADITNESEED